MIAPVCPLLFQCTPYIVSTNHLITHTLSTDMNRYIYNVPFRYMSPCLSFPQSSLPGWFTLMVKKETRFCTSSLALVHRNRRCAMVRWNWLACSSCNSFLSSSPLTSNMLPLAGDACIPLSISGNSSMIFWRYFIIDTFIVSTWISAKIHFHA